MLKLKLLRHAGCLSWVACVSKPDTQEVIGNVSMWQLMWSASWFLVVSHTTKSFQRSKTGARLGKTAVY